jgi:hypothetical protein
MGGSPIPALAHMMMLRESIASVSLSHAQGCDCDTCKAAQGDDDAFARMVDRLESRPS